MWASTPAKCAQRAVASYCGPTSTQMRMNEFSAFGAGVLQYLLQYERPDVNAKRVWRWALQKVMARAWQAIPDAWH